MDDINFERGSTASLVAALLGFADASSDAAAGFQINYRELARRGAFDGAQTVGDVLKVYCLALAERQGESSGCGERGVTQQAQYTGHGANTGGLQAHSIGESYPYLVVGIDNPERGDGTRWRVVNAITGKATFYDFQQVDLAHEVAERAAAGCTDALSLFS